MFHKHTNCLEHLFSPCREYAIQLWTDRQLSGFVQCGVAEHNATGVFISHAGKISVLQVSCPHVEE